MISLFINSVGQISVIFWIFEKVFTKAAVIKLEQNYRSTANILNAANAAIDHNHGRKDKTLWTDNEDGDKIAFRQFDTAFDEAEYMSIRYKRTRGEKGECGLSGQRHFYIVRMHSPVCSRKICNSKYSNIRLLAALISMQDGKLKIFLHI